MANLGMDGEQCDRCRERGLLAEFNFSTATPFTTDRVSVVMCSRCLDEFVTGKADRVKYPVNSIGVPLSRDDFAEYNENSAGDHIYYKVMGRDEVMESTLYGWVQGHV